MMAQTSALSPEVDKMPRAVGTAQPDWRDDDGPVRIEVAMPRVLFDRLTSHDGAPVCRYETATGVAEFVAAPRIAHESRSWLISRLFSHIEAALADSGRFPTYLVAPSVRLLSPDGAFEPDTCIFVDPVRAIRAEEQEGYLDTEKGHPVPDLVVEIDRSRDSAYKLGPYFRMGVREGWTWSVADGLVIWAPDANAAEGFAPMRSSNVFPGLDRESLDRLLAVGSGREERFRLSRQLAEQVARALLSTAPKRPGAGQVTPP